MTQIETTNERVVIGQIVPFDRGSVPAVREDYTKAIQLWCQTRDTAAALTREEIGAMRKDDRIDAHRKAIIINLAHYYRENPRADVAPGVLVVLTLLSDNEKGAASISQPTLAKLFDRALSSIGEAQKRLKDAGVIVTSRGRYAATYPVIPRAVTTSYNHLTWLVSAVCEHDDGAVNLPVPPVDCQSTGLPGGLIPDGNQSTGGSGGLKLVNQPVEDVSINRSARCLLQDKNSKEDIDVISARDARSFTKAVALGIAAAAGALPAAAAPIEPPAIIQPVNPVHALADKLHDAGGRALNLTRPDLHVVEVPRNWMAAGCDLELDILPIMRAMTANKAPNSVSTWKYFEQAIMNAKAARLAPVADGQAPPGKTKQRLAPWEEDQLRLKREADEVSEKLKAQYRREMEEQARG